jgi:zinc protease
MTEDSTHLASERYVRNAFCLVWATLVWAIFLCSLSFSAPLRAQPLGLDPQVFTGTLANGLRYFLRPTESAGIDVRLVVKAGSLDERDDELGYAHFVEHLAFRQTKNYKDGEIINFVRSLGGNFGQHLNASTSFNVTQYFFALPPSKESSLPQALKVLSDWAFDIDFTSEIINIERGVVVAEKRSRDQSTQPIFKIRQALYDQGLYKREVVGSYETIASATAERLKVFYKRHYTPNRMSVVISGKFAGHPSEWVKTIDALFGQATNDNATVPVVETFSFPDRLRVLQLPGAERPTLAFVTFAPQSVGKTKADFAQWVARTIAVAALNERLRETAKDHKWVLNQSASEFALTQDAKAFQIALSMNDRHHFEQGLELLKRSVEKFVQDGPSADELAAVKRPMLRAALTSEQESSKQSAQAVGSLLGAYAQSGGYYLSSTRYRELLEEILPSISAAQVVREIANRMNSKDRMILAQSQRGDPLPRLSEANLEQKTAMFASRIAQAAATSTALSEASEVSLRNLNFARPSARGSIQFEEQIGNGTTKLTLSNGAIVYVKALSSTVDQVAMTMRGPGGLWSQPVEKLPVARLAQAGALLGDGIGPYNQPRFEQALAEKNLRFSIAVGPMHVGVNIRARSDDLPFALNAFHQFVKEAKVNPVNFARQQDQIRPSLYQGNIRSEQKFQRDGLSARRPSNAWLEPMSIAQLDSVTPDMLKSFHQDLFGDASQWVFAFTGNVVLRDIRRLCETFLANLPSSGNAPVDFQYASFPEEKSNVRWVTKAGTADKATLLMRYTNPQIKDTLASGGISAQMSSVLKNRLRLALRQDTGLSYSPNGNVQISGPPIQGMLLSVEVTIAPNDLEKVESIIRTTVQSLIETPPTQEELNAFKQQYLMDGRNLMVEPSSSAELLLTLHQRKLKFDQLLEFRSAAASQDAATINRAFKEVLNGVTPSVGILISE